MWRLYPVKRVCVNTQHVPAMYPGARTAANRRTNAIVKFCMKNVAIPEITETSEVVVSDGTKFIKSPTPQPTLPAKSK
jgi:hypothetical protein